ncbi:uncharacterized protein LOC103578759 [Microplitis demolitor]|uniref:uncharacterized protein LOC103578759 n=1 Tax=Microplitis demolitor TaxID=69319 RepID=UPI0004CCFDAA|nr:uncharacterized protein LOC103578759 [Microplitis demolitor]
MKLLIILGIVTLTLANKNKTLSARTYDIDFIDENEDKSASNPQKRDSGYFYSRPRLSFASRIKNTRLSGRIVRPFMTYGPPKSPVNSSTKNKYENVNLSRPNPQFQAPDPLKLTEFTQPSPIASQNEEPFKLNSAKYLPPKNQKLPSHSATYFNRPQAPQNFESQKLRPNPSANGQISDAAQFLQQNAQAISNLYQRPATNQNYEPLPEKSLSGSVNSIASASAGVSDFISSRSHQSEALPSYASGTLEPYRSLEQIQSREKDQLISELRHQLAVQDSAQSGQRYDHHGDYLSNFPIQNNGDKLNYGFIGQSVYGSVNSVDQAALGGSGTSVPAVHQPQNTNQGNSHPSNSLPTSVQIPGAFPFPQYAEGFAPVIGGTNFVTGTSLPSYGSTFFGSNTPGQIDSPTHFSIPIPTVANNNKPLTPPKPSFPSFHPVSAGHGIPSTSISSGQTSVVHPQPLPHPIHPIQPIQPVHHVHPVYNIQTIPVSPVVLKPVKPVYPVYYPTVPYVLQKPSAPTTPQTYAPSYSVIKAAQIW